MQKADKCYFCPETECLELHHIIPRRFNGSDRTKNLVTVCSTCHRKLERLYNDEDFYRQLGVIEPSDMERTHREYDRISTTDDHICYVRQEDGWKVKYDSEKHFLFFCPECDKEARVNRINIDQSRYDVVFEVFCPACKIEGSMQLYTHPEQDIDLTPLENLTEEIEPPEELPDDDLQKKTEMSDWVGIGEKIKEIDQLLRDIWTTNTIPKKSKKELNILFNRLDNARDNLSKRMWEEHNDRGDIDVFY